MSIQKSLARTISEADKQENIQVNVESAPTCLREVELFEKIPQQELAELNRMLPLVKYSAGEIIYDPLRPKSILFIIKGGRVRIFQTALSGKTLTLSVLNPGDVFGTMPILGQDMGNSYAETLEETTICRLDQEQVEKYFLADSRISQQVALILSKRVNELETRLSDLALRPLPQRVASLLLNTSVTSPLPWRHERVVKLTHEQLANLAGASREGVSKVLADFAQRKFIKQGRGMITLLTPDALRQFKESVPEY
ncbi:Crp/Fnr family transcriptional regulator [Actinomycetaceae bacterium TAE3-ERU4]|nr:Crp/Fnr family transcriptional regulator [Actinomycetaceae bacterium TAE3-ERU4]